MTSNRCHRSSWSFHQRQLEPQNVGPGVCLYFRDKKEILDMGDIGQSIQAASGVEDGSLKHPCLVLGILPNGLIRVVHMTHLNGSPLREKEMWRQQTHLPISPAPLNPVRSEIPPLHFTETSLALKYKDSTYVKTDNYYDVDPRMLKLFVANRPKTHIMSQESLFIIQQDVEYWAENPPYPTSRRSSSSSSLPGRHQQDNAQWRPRSLPTPPLTPPPSAGSKYCTSSTHGAHSCGYPMALPRYQQPWRKQKIGPYQPYEHKSCWRQGVPVTFPTPQQHYVVQSGYHGNHHSLTSYVPPLI